MSRQLTLLFLLLCYFTPTLAQPLKSPNSYQGQYERISPAAETYSNYSDQTVEMLEIFLYTCPHCHRFEPFLSAWQVSKPKDIQFVQMPAVFNETNTLLAKAFYAAEELGVLAKLHSALYEAIHTHHRQFDTEAALMDFFAEQGVDKAAFKTTFNSFAVDTKVRRARMLTADYGITGVPAVVVHGKYRLTNSKAGGYENLLKIVEHLAEELRDTPTTP